MKNNEPEIIGLEKLKKYYNQQEIIEDYEYLRFSTLSREIRYEREIEIINTAMQSIQNNSPPRLLEIAVGPGTLTKDIALSGVGVGIDTSKKMLNIAKKRVNDLRWNFICADVMNMPFKNECFDIVVVFHLLRHFKEKERKEAYSEIYRVLNQDGWMIFEMLNKRPKKTKLQRILSNTFKKIFTKKGNSDSSYNVYSSFFTPIELIEELKGHNFSPVFIYGLGQNNTLTVLLKFFHRKFCKFGFLQSFIKSLIIQLERKYKKKLEYSFEFITIAKKET